jgi:hypothetical protein
MSLFYQTIWRYWFVICLYRSFLTDVKQVGRSAWKVSGITEQPLDFLMSLTQNRNDPSDGSLNSLVRLNPIIRGVDHNYHTIDSVPIQDSIAKTGRSQLPVQHLQDGWWHDTSRDNLTVYRISSSIHQASKLKDAAAESYIGAVSSGAPKSLLAMDSPCYLYPTLDNPWQAWSFASYNSNKPFLKCANHYCDNLGAW